MKKLYKTLTIAGVLLGAISTQSYATDISYGAPKKRAEIRFEKDMEYWKSLGVYNRPATKPFVSEAPLTRDQQRSKVAWDYWNKNGYKNESKKSVNNTTISSAPLTREQKQYRRAWDYWQ